MIEFDESTAEWAKALVEEWTHDNGLSMDQASQLMGVSVKVLSKVLAGRSARYQPQKLAGLSKAMGYTSTSLAGVALGEPPVRVAEGLDAGISEALAALNAKVEDLFRLVEEAIREGALRPPSP